MTDHASDQLKRNVLVTALAAVIMGGFVLAYLALAPEGLASGMGRMAGPIVPPVKGYLDGQEIRFIHTETSDAEVANLLSTMMDSPVLHVPSLAEAPGSMLAAVYVFKNGVEGRGPFGFQPDVFESPPGSDGYRPLRAVHLVQWQPESTARELRSAAEVKEGEGRGELLIERRGIVVNMPLLTWPGGRR